MVPNPTENDQQAEIYVNKLEAARRQIDAAIRMFLIDEDCLGIHSVVSACYRVLRDLLEHRGRYERDEIIRDGIYHIARRVADGTLTREELHNNFEEEVLCNFIEEIASKIANGSTKEDIDLTVRSSEAEIRRECGEKSVVSNFLKHADRDECGVIRLNIVDNLGMIFRAIQSYKMLNQTLTPEMNIGELLYWSSIPEIVQDANLEDHDILIKLSSLT